MIVNDDLQRAYDDLKAIVRAERLKVGRVEAAIEPFVDTLVKA